MNLPITSRVKRSPLLKTKNEIATGSKTTPGKDKEVEVTETRRKQSDIDFEKNCYNADGSRATDKEGCKWADTEGTETPSSTETITTTKIEPGEDKVVDVDLKRKQYQDVMEGPWEQRRILRQGRMVGRQKARYERKLRKYGTFDKDGNFTEKDGLSQRQQSKSRQYQEGLIRTESARKRTDEGIASGKRPGSRIKRTEDRDATTGEFTDVEQIKMGARRQEIAANEANLTTKQSTNAIDVEAPNPFSAGLDRAKAIAEEGLNYKAGKYNFSSAPTTMKPSAYKMKAKSPAAKNLQGNQGKLPQHLQDAIKSAPESPNKMRSGFKMKGYGKK